MQSETKLKMVDQSVEEVRVNDASQGDNTGREITACGCGGGNGVSEDLACDPVLDDEEGVRLGSCPEALPDEMWTRFVRFLGSAGLRYVRFLVETNGNTGEPPPDESVVWGLRSTDTGRWIRNHDVKGVPCLQAFKTRELAKRYQCAGNEVVWMHASDWWRKVEDAAKTGFPPRVNLLSGIEDGRTIEHTWSCNLLAEDSAKGLEAFVEELGTSAETADGVEEAWERIQVDTPSEGEGGVALVSLSPEREETEMQIEKGL